MCGISIIAGTNEYLNQRIKKMTDSISHRGPDGDGAWVSDEKGIALGHRRLSIIDLSTRGSQPMIGSSDNFVITYNGEVYNFQKIKEELLLKGHQFHSDTDTEVILRSYEEAGSRCVDKFNGMWAFAIYDGKQDKIFLSRDRFGVKPLYYYWDGNIFIAASEIKAILASGLIKAEVDLEGLNEYFTFQNIISDRTLFKNIKLLPPGHNASYDIKNKSLNIERYWDLFFSPSSETSEGEFIKSVSEKFNEAVSDHLISDVPVGVTISGGMDSSAITAIASKHVKDLNTFTGGFDTSNLFSGDRSFDERNDAKVIADLFKTKHHERLITADYLRETLPKIVWHLEDPRVGICTTFYSIAELVSESVKVSLSGTGGDEIFAGYPWRYDLIKDKFNRDEFDSAFYGYWSRLIKDDQKKDFFTQKTLDAIDINQPFAEYRLLIEKVDSINPVDKALYFENKTFLHGMLAVEDKMGMAFSIETRFPFLDLNLVELASTIPIDLKYKNGVSKYILKKSFESILPKEILEKRKQGFTPPELTWYRRELKEYVHNLLLGEDSLSGEYINREFVKRIIDEHNNGADHRLLLWSLMFFEQWCRTFLSGQSEFSPEVTH